jgi:hypothetical protein
VAARPLSRPIRQRYPGKKTIVKNKQSVAGPGGRASRWENIRKSKMARSPHAYEGVERGALPQGPEIWICGDCHVGNLGPIGSASGKIQIQIRDLDQTVIGNPAHDLIRLSLSLASAARGSDVSAVSRRRIAPQQTKATGKPLSLLCWKSVTGERGARGNWRSLSRSRRRSSQHEAEYSNRPPLIAVTTAIRSCRSRGSSTLFAHSGRPLQRYSHV